MDRCVALIKELREYKFKPKTLDDTGNSDKPVDKNNHGINALEWIVMELPANPNNLVYGIYGRDGQDITKPERRQQLQYGDWALRDTQEDVYEYEIGGWY